MCSGVYLNKNLELKSKFKEDVESVFMTGMETIDFSNPIQAVDTINTWVKFLNHNCTWQFKGEVVGAETANGITRTNTR